MTGALRKLEPETGTGDSRDSRAGPQGSEFETKKAPNSKSGAFVSRFWRARRDSNPQPLGPKPSTLSVELQAQTVGASFLGRATGFEPVISCATDRRLGPLGYARRTAIDWSLGL